MLPATRYPLQEVLQNQQTMMARYVYTYVYPLQEVLKNQQTMMARMSM